MVSFNVASMDPVAKRIRNIGQEHGLSVWICTACIGAGEDWRTAIRKAVEGADVVVCLMNRAWVDSVECQDESNIAINLNLHQKRPRIIPVALPDVHKSLHTGVPLAMASRYNLVMVDSTDPEVVARKVFDALG